MKRPIDIIEQSLRMHPTLFLDTVNLRESEHRAAANMTHSPAARKAMTKCAVDMLDLMELAKADKSPAELANDIIEAGLHIWIPAFETACRLNCYHRGLQAAMVNAYPRGK